MATIELREHPGGRNLVGRHSGRGFQDLSPRRAEGSGINDLLALLDERMPTPEGIRQLGGMPVGWDDDVWELVATASNEDPEMPGGAVIQIYPEHMLEAARTYFNVR